MDNNTEQSDMSASSGTELGSFNGLLNTHYLDNLDEILMSLSINEGVDTDMKDSTQQDSENPYHTSRAAPTTGGGNLLPMEQWQQRYPSGVAPGIQHQEPQVMQPGHMTQTSMQQNQMGVHPGTAPINAPRQMMQNQALYQLLATLRSPRSAEQQQQILRILKSNPQLMAAFIQKRQQAQQIQQASGGTPPQQQLQHILNQQPNSNQQHANRMQMQGGLINQAAAQGLNQGPGPGQPMTQQQQWFKHQQMLAMQRQQQQQLMQSVRSPPPIRSPQPSPSSRTAPSPRNQAVASPRGPQPSSHDLATSEMLLSQNHSNTLQHYASLVSTPNQDSNNEVPQMTPQEQLSKFVEQL